MTDDMPTTREVLKAWQEYAHKDDGSHNAEFLRWLDDYTRRVSRAVWEDAINHVDPWLPREIRRAAHLDNPYRFRPGGAT